jgi:hypothetical protein
MVFHVKRVCERHVGHTRFTPLQTTSATDAPRARRSLPTVLKEGCPGAGYFALATTAEDGETKTVARLEPSSPAGSCCNTENPKGDQPVFPSAPLLTSLESQAAAFLLLG